jgi:hypothetical protein
MAHNEQDFAVRRRTSRPARYLNSQFRKGTVTGELMRSSPLMFRTFTISRCCATAAAWSSSPALAASSAIS